MSAKNYGDAEGSRTLDEAIARIAHRHEGYITRKQLLALGLGDAGIQHRVQVGRLFRVYPGVYAVGWRPSEWRQRAAGALLYAGNGAVLADLTAAALWGLRSYGGPPLQLIAPRAHRPQPGLRIRGAKLHDRDRTKREGLWVTGLPRTVVDLTPLLDTTKARQRAINDARVNHNMRIEELRWTVERYPRHPGAKLLIPLIAEAPVNPFRSPFEPDWVPFAAKYDLPHYEMNVPIPELGIVVDVIFLAYGLVVELDGWQTHGSRHAFESDRDRDAALLARGLTTVRITRRRLRSQPAREAERLHQILAFLQASQTRVG